MSRDASPVRQSKPKCEICKFIGCKTKIKKIPEEDCFGETISDEKTRKRLCCRCIQSVDSMIYKECSSHEQCKVCEESTRSCVICERDDCSILENYDVECGCHADLTGYYCCLHAEDFSQTFNNDRFSIRGYETECDSCRLLICKTEGLREKLERLEEIEENYSQIMRGKDFEEVEKERIRIIQQFFEQKRR